LTTGVHAMPLLSGPVVIEKVMPLQTPNQRSASSDRIFKTQRLYVGNLPYDVSSNELEVLFGRFGAVKEVHMGRDRKTGLSKGYAFIEYVKESDAKEARDGLQGFELRGRSLRLDVNVKQSHHPNPSPAPLSPGLTSPVAFSGEAPSLQDSGGSPPSLFAPFASAFGDFSSFSPSSLSTPPTTDPMLRVSPFGFGSPATLQAQQQPQQRSESAWFSNREVESFGYSAVQQWKVVLVGDGEVGKSAWANRLAHGDYLAEYSATVGQNPVAVTLVTTRGTVTLNLIDCAGQVEAPLLT
ncbi:MAG TPA: hypothetical protein V6D20_19100, partial [Candidatus Obscuribacterales bacterium]